MTIERNERGQPNERTKGASHIPGVCDKKTDGAAAHSYPEWRPAAFQASRLDLSGAIEHRPQSGKGPPRASGHSSQLSSEEWLSPSVSLDPSCGSRSGSAKVAGPFHFLL